MCGFCGFTGAAANAGQTVRLMTEKITYRGPDSDGFYEDGQIAMGFRRLSIIDLETGEQPLYNEDESLVLMFNGEIYNYQSLRDELLAAGHSFRTKSDSEVLLHGYEQWGESLPLKLRGMFAFAIYNKSDGSLFLARDYFGIKPLYYTLLPDGRFVYGSEIKCILTHPDVKKEFNEAALERYLSFQYSFPPETFFKDIFCLPPAHTLFFKDGEIEVRRYWEAEFAPDDSLTLEDCANQIEKVFADSVEAHRISDVEVGCFLSSGVDSTFVASFFEGQKAFTVGFAGDEHYNESIFAAESAKALGLRHYTHLIGEDEYWDSLPHIQYVLDQPLADPACVALYFVSKLAAEQVKVVLSGEGADELFGGYRIYHEPYSLAGYQKLPLFLRKIAAGIASLLPDFKGKSFLQRGAKTLTERFIGNAYMFSKKEKIRLLKRIPATDPAQYTRPFYDRTKGQDDTTRMQALDINCWMVGDILLKADRMSMAHSLELRVPFLDREVFETARRIPVRHRIGGGTTKYAMRAAAARRIPKSAADKPKLGFPVPVRVWLRSEKYYARVKEAFLSPACARFFNQDELVRLLDAHYRGKKDNSRKIWTVYMFLIWYGVFFPEDENSAAR